MASKIPLRIEVGTKYFVQPFAAVDASGQYLDLSKCTIYDINGTPIDFSQPFKTTVYDANETQIDFTDAFKSILYDTNNNPVNLTGGVYPLIDNPLYDTTGHLRISQKTKIGDYKQLFAQDTLLFTRAGTGTSAWAGSIETISCDPGEYYVMRSKEFHHYYSGNPQLIEATQINFECVGDEIKRYGYFSSSIVAPYTANFDGFFIENNAGTITLQIWNDGTKVVELDPSEGEGAEYFAQVDWSKFNVQLFDFLWLGGAALRWFQLVGGRFRYITGYTHQGQAATVFMKSPNQPLRIELRANTNAATLSYVCAQVTTEGTADPEAGKVFSFENLITLQTAATEYLVLAIRQPSTYRHIAAYLDSYTFASRSNNQVRFKVVLNPTITNNPSPYTALAGSSLEYALGNGTTITSAGGLLIGGSSTNTNIAANSSRNSFLNRINSNIDGTSDTIVVTAIPAANNAIVDIFVNIREL